MTDTNARIQLKLYVAGGAPNSTRALRNAHSLRDRIGAGEVHLEIVDVFAEPERALQAGVLLTPMLVLEAGQPARRRSVVGTLDDHAQVLSALDLALGA